MGRLTRAAILTFMMLGFVSAGSAFAGTHYVATNGSDSNDGATKTTPWAHLPGMATWSGSYAPVAGDTFILRGCDVWGNSNFPVNWKWSGSSGNPIVVDRDTTWFNTTNCPSGWNRAVFDAENEAMNPNKFLHVQNGNSSTTYATFRWIEARNLFWTSTNPSGALAYVDFNSADFITIQNWYIHHWTHGSGAGDTDNMVAGVFGSNSGFGCEHCSFDHNVVDNTDGDGGSSKTMSGGGINIPSTYNVITGMTNAFKVFTGGEWAYNNISRTGQDFNQTFHPNCFESIAAGLYGTSGVFYYHDNYTHNTQNCEGFQVGNPNETDYAWNNVWDMSANAAGNNGPQVPQTGGTGNWSLYFWNNTVAWGAGCIVTDSGGHGTAIKNWFFQNNYCISGGATSSGTALSPNGSSSLTNNIGVSTPTSSSQGYSSESVFPYEPTSSTCNGNKSDCTIGVGLNLTSVWPSGFATTDMGALCTEQTISGVLQSVCTKRGNNRPASGLWDVGAYYFPTDSSGAPNPPTSVTAAVQ
jgi:hypothetical protein